MFTTELLQQVENDKQKLEQLCDDYLQHDVTTSDLAHVIAGLCTLVKNCGQHHGQSLGVLPLIEQTWDCSEGHYHQLQVGITSRGTIFREETTLTDEDNELEVERSQWTIDNFVSVAEQYNIVPKLVREIRENMDIILFSVMRGPAELARA